MKKLSLLELFGQGWPGARPEGDASHRVVVRQPRKCGTPTFPYVDSEESSEEETMQDHEIAAELQLEFKTWRQGPRPDIVGPPGFDIEGGGGSTGNTHTRVNNSQNPERVKSIALDQPGDIADEEMESFNKWISGEDGTGTGRMPTLGETLGRVLKMEFTKEDGTESVDDYLEDKLKEVRGGRGLPAGDGTEMVVTKQPWASGVSHQSTTNSRHRELEEEKEDMEEEIGLSLESLYKKIVKEYATTDWARQAQHRSSRERSDFDFFEKTSGNHQFLMNTIEEFEENQKGLGNEDEYDEDEDESDEGEGSFPFLGG